jgi:hypothetical protein
LVWRYQELRSNGLSNLLGSTEYERMTVSLYLRFAHLAQVDAPLELRMPMFRKENIHYGYNRGLHCLEFKQVAGDEES